jgi:aryl-alcohol dehydrogenase-like predicted oxidoreductase
MKLALGTVQFGLNYGVSNSRGQVTSETVAAILSCARHHGIAWLDTAAAYGESESVLGTFQNQFPDFQICTKTIPITSGNIDASSIATVREGFYRSLQRLKRSQVDLLMVHHAGNLLLPGAGLLHDLLQHFKSEGLAKAIGFSAYDPQEADAVLAQFQFDGVQMPCNVLDQRLMTSGLAAKLHANSTQLFIRSVFLQGVLVSDLPQFADHAALVKLRDFARSHQLSALQLALGFIKTLGAAHAVVGVTSVRELTEIIEAFEMAPALDFAQLASDDADLIDPRRWPTSPQELPP